MNEKNPQPPEPPALSKAEWEVMKPFWDKGPMAARDVYAALESHQDWAIKTVKTLLARLVAKGALEYEQIGNSYLYRPAYTREQMTRYEVRGFLDRVFGGAFGAMFANFIEEEDLAEQDIHKLAEILEKKKDAPPSRKRPQA